eukprot:CAMPEP_0202890958 /NCGR_PEP_ID=MMETSP1392-20130828/1187_1 /ASSEMBLY_ACC=CAM_ASM_000868 /TAXON_ID=225041 /ORGANISM="Chlamydomonas chlamydogama, Strain SAG 11-48b" /LENGTH=78 /DNA_ID=CAMNT_0049574615 /DNA_START=1467 /DNA_END=1703 /DNA_ORIENTATION=+
MPAPYLTCRDFSLLARLPLLCEDELRIEVPGSGHIICGTVFPVQDMFMTALLHQAAVAEQIRPGRNRTVKEREMIYHN